MSINRDDLIEGLIRFNYFPAQKKNKDEIPTNIRTENVTIDVAKEISEIKYRNIGYDNIQYRISRYNNVYRTLSIPHPLAYFRLCFNIYSNWDKLKYICENEGSLILPSNHFDGRVIIMDYENSEKHNVRYIEKSHNKKFIVKTDITNFYPSIYSHSIPWALVGLKKSKQTRSNKVWFNQFDTSVRLVTRNETNGVPIGPGTSNIISEIILEKIDRVLEKKRFSFYRFVDDYKAFTSTYERAEEFIRILSEELSKYKLILNRKKTYIYKLPYPISPEWIIDITTRKPDNNTIVRLSRFLDYAVLLQKEHSDQSILKFAVKSIIDKIDGEIINPLLNHILSLSFKNPILIPQLQKLFNKIEPDAEFKYRDQLLNILIEQIQTKQSDGMAWIIYFLNQFSEKIPEDIASNIISTNDCISILQLYLSHEHDDKIIDFYNNHFKNDVYEIDQFWLLLYQLYFDDKIPNPYENADIYKHYYKNREIINVMVNEKQVFEILKNNNITFCIEEELEKKELEQISKSLFKITNK